MKITLSKKIMGYLLIIFIVLSLSGFILAQVVTNIYVLISVLVITFIIFAVMLFHFFDKYIKPIEKASWTMDKLLQGNYYARVNQEMNGTIGELSGKINTLAKNLSKLTIQEQIQAEQLSTIIENSESALVLIDEKGYIHIVNRKFLSVFGKTSQAYVGYIYYDVIDHEAIHHTVQETFLYEKRVKETFSITHNDEKIYLELVGAPIFNERKMLKGAVLVIYDITEFKHIELMRKDFVANVGYELQAPIKSIKADAEKLQNHTSIDDISKDTLIKIIYEESTRIEMLLDDLLILSNLEKDETKLHLRTVKTGEMIDDILPSIQEKAEKKDILISVEASREIEFTADEEKVKQILFNLMMNGITYTPEQGEVKLEIHSNGDNIRFKVSDNGIGISKHAIPRIFERFYRVDKDRSINTNGTGLGLAIVKHIVEVHNGEIQVDSELEHGTSFTIDIPKSQTVNATSTKRIGKEHSHDKQSSND